MFRQDLQPKTLLKTTIAALLMVTLSGAYFLFCCQEIYAAGKPEHCPTKKPAKTEHCHFSKHKSSDALAATTNINSAARCALKFNFFIAKLEKNEFPQNTPVLANNFFSFLESVKPADLSGFTDFSYRAPVRETHDLHVRNCVFRI